MSTKIDPDILDAVRALALAGAWEVGGQLVEREGVDLCPVCIKPMTYQKTKVIRNGVVFVICKTCSFSHAFRSGRLRPPYTFTEPVGAVDLGKDFRTNPPRKKKP